MDPANVGAKGDQPWRPPTPVEAPTPVENNTTYDVEYDPASSNDTSSDEGGEASTDDAEDALPPPPPWPRLSTSPHYDVPRRVQPWSRLWLYLLSKRPLQAPARRQEPITLRTVLLLVQDIIDEEGLLDRQWPGLIRCNKALERILGQTLLTQKELEGLLLKHLTAEITTPEFAGDPMTKLDLGPIYEAPRRFLPDSRLRAYLVRKCCAYIPPTLEEPITLKQVILVLRNIIKSEGLYDKTNPTIIMCGPDLEQALDVKWIHMNQLPIRVMKQMTAELLPGMVDHEYHKKAVKRRGSVGQAPAPKKPELIPAEQRFAVTPKFRRVIHEVPGVPRNQVEFTYEELGQILTGYIARRKDKFFDPRNVEVAFIGDDPLGEAFGIQTIHQSQTGKYLQRQLIPDPNPGSGGGPRR